MRLVILLLLYSVSACSQTVLRVPGKNGVVTAQGVPPTYDTDAQAYFSALSYQSSPRKDAFNRLVLSAKAYGVWSKIVALWPNMGSTAADQKWNAKDPQNLDAAYRLTYSSDDAGAHSSDGYTPNGTSQYAGTHLVPATVFTTNNLYSYGFYALTQTANTKAAMAANYTSTGEGNKLRPTWTGSRFWYGINSSYLYGAYGAERRGVHTVNSVGYSTQQKNKYYLNGQMKFYYTGIGQVGAPNLPDEQFTLGAYIGAVPEYNNIKIGMAWVTTEMNEGEQYIWSKIVQDYYDEIGIAPISESTTLAFFFGDSITERTSGATAQDQTYNPANKRWTTEFCNTKGLTEVNFGRAGTTLQAATIRQTGGRFGKGMIDRISEIPAYNSTNHKLIVFAFGTNDIDEGNLSAWDSTTFYNNYITVLDSAIARGWPTAKIALVNAYYTTSTAMDNNKPSCNRRIAAVATAKTIQLYDAFQYMTDNGGSGLLCSDGIHPNSTGMTTVATGAVAAITVP